MFKVTNYNDMLNWGAEVDKKLANGLFEVTANDGLTGLLSVIARKVFVTRTLTIGQTCIDRSFGAYVHCIFTKYNLGKMKFVHSSFHPQQTLRKIYVQHWILSVDS